MARGRSIETSTTPTGRPQRAEPASWRAGAPARPRSAGDRTREKKMGQRSISLRLPRHSSGATWFIVPHLTILLLVRSVKASMASERSRVAAARPQETSNASLRRRRRRRARSSCSRRQLAADGIGLGSPTARVGLDREFIQLLRVRRTVPQRLGHVRPRHPIGVVEIGDRSCDFQHAMIGSGREPRAFRRGREELTGVAVHTLRT